MHDAIAVRRRTGVLGFNSVFLLLTKSTVCGEDVEVMERLAVIFMSLLAVSQRSIDVWVGPGESWIHWTMGCGAVGTYAGG